MSLLLRSADFIYTFRFLKLLVTPFEKTPAYALGIIDKEGNRVKDVEITDSMKSSYTAFHRLVFNIKKIMAKLPGGSTTIASYAAALYLLKEKYGVDPNKALKESPITTLDIQENASNWYKDENGYLFPGTYKVLNNKVINETCDEFVRKGDQVRITGKPVGIIFGIDIYEAVHSKTQQKIYVATGELTK